jgi:pyridoxal phosphate enzyme (YggS family)
MIGHLQKNKARHVVRSASVVQTVSSSALARELGRRAAEWPVPESRRFPSAGLAADHRLAVMVEVNLGREAQKSGCQPEQLAAVLDAVVREPALSLRGLMTLPPHTADPAGSRRYFDELARLRDQHGGRRQLPELSMGMTHDLEHAVAAGATMVRVGTAIFGPR